MDDTGRARREQLLHAWARAGQEVALIGRTDSLRRIQAYQRVIANLVRALESCATMDDLVASYERGDRPLLAAFDTCAPEDLSSIYLPRARAAAYWQRFQQLLSGLQI